MFETSSQTDYYSLPGGRRRAGSSCLLCFSLVFGLWLPVWRVLLLIVVRAIIVGEMVFTVKGVARSSSLPLVLLRYEDQAWAKP